MKTPSITKVEQNRPKLQEIYYIKRSLSFKSISAHIFPNLSTKSANCKRGPNYSVQRLNSGHREPLSALVLPARHPKYGTRPQREDCGRGGAHHDQPVFALQEVPPRLSTTDWRSRHFSFHRRSSGRPFFILHAGRRRFRTPTGRPYGSALHRNARLASLQPGRRRSPAALVAFRDVRQRGLSLPGHRFAPEAAERFATFGGATDARRLGGEEDVVVLRILVLSGICERIRAFAATRRELRAAGFGRRTAAVGCFSDFGIIFAGTPVLEIRVVAVAGNAITGHAVHAAVVAGRLFDRGPSQRIDYVLAGGEPRLSGRP